MSLGDHKEFVNAPHKPRVRPAYKVSKIDGDVETTIFTKDQKSGKLVRKTVKEPGGYMVHCMNGSSVRARTVEDLKKMNISSLIPLVDSASGEVVGEIEL